MIPNFEIKLPRDNVNDEFVTILNIHFSNGDFVKKDSIIIEYETSKAAVEFVTEHDGYIKYHCLVGDEIEPGAVVATIYPEKYDLALVNNESIDNISEKPIVTQILTKFSKDAKKLISEYELNESDFIEYEFVNKDMVLEFLESRKVNKVEIKSETVLSSEEKLSSDETNYDIIKITPAKKREINYLKNVQSNSLNSSFFISINLNNLINFIDVNSTKLKSSILPIVVFEISKMLLTYREFNAFFKNDFVYYYKKINVGVAIDIDKELKVLTIYDSDKKGYSEIENKIWELSNKYLDDKLDPYDISNSTFTISDLSSGGTDFFIPLINSHQSAILGVGQINEKSKESVFVITFDHRIMSGKIVANFLNDLKRRLESYYVKMVASNSKLKCMKCLIGLREEQGLNAHGLIKVVDSDGNDNYICTNCLSGW